MKANKIELPFLAQPYGTGEDSSPAPPEIPITAPFYVQNRTIYIYTLDLT